MADDPGSPDPSQPTNAAPAEELRPRGDAAIGPPQTDADAVGPAVASAAGLPLSGASAGSRGVRRIRSGSERQPRASIHPRFCSGRRRPLRLGPRGPIFLATRRPCSPTISSRWSSSNGERLWMRGDDFRINFAQVVVGRDAAGSEEVEVPLTHADRLARPGNARTGGVGHQGTQGVRCRSCRRIRESDRAAGRLSAGAVEEAAGAGQVVSLQYRSPRASTSPRRTSPATRPALRGCCSSTARCRARGVVLASSGRSPVRRS